MVVGRPRIATVDVSVPTVIHDAFAGFIASAGSWTLMHRNGSGIDVFLLDMLQMAHGGVLGAVGGSRGCDADRSLVPFSPCLPNLVGCGHGCMEGGELAHHPLIVVLLICMHCLSMLAQIIEAGELFRAMASKGAFASVFPNVPGEVFASAEDHATLAITSALEGLCWCRTVAFCDAGVGGRVGREEGGVVWSDEGHVRRGR
jgi:hypothetical protein